LRGHVGPTIHNVSDRHHTGNDGPTKLTKSALIVGAFDLPLLWVGIQTFVTGGAVTVLGEPPALRHASQVVLVEKLTSIPFLTKASEPMLTHSGESLSVSRMCR
jgi:hypothetical protein